MQLPRYFGNKWLRAYFESHLFSLRKLLTLDSASSVQTGQRKHAVLRHVIRRCMHEIPLGRRRNPKMLTRPMFIIILGDCQLTDRNLAAMRVLRTIETKTRAVLKTWNYCPSLVPAWNYTTFVSTIATSHYRVPSWAHRLLAISSFENIQLPPLLSRPIYHWGDVSDLTMAESTSAVTRYFIRSMYYISNLE